MTQDHVYGVAIVVFGLIVGSFLNVCIYRIPRGISIVAPSSHCTACGNKIRPFDNIPVLSYLILGGKCRFCQSPISLRYLAIESMNAVMYYALYAFIGFGWQLMVLWVYVSYLIARTAIHMDGLLNSKEL